MSNKNNINEVIKDEYKIDENEELKNKIIIDETDNSFNQLQSLQILIQKQSGLKDLCK